MIDKQVSKYTTPNDPINEKDLLNFVIAKHNFKKKILHSFGILVNCGMKLSISIYRGIGLFF